jgi:hypothetical protein
MGMYMPAAIICGVGQFFAGSKFKKLENKDVKHPYSSLTGRDVAEMILHQNEITNVKITEGKECKYFFGKKRMTLSKAVFNKSSVSTAALAAHEVGHFFQDQKSSVIGKILLYTFIFTLITSILGIVLFPFHHLFQSFYHQIWVSNFAAGTFSAFFKLFLEFDASFSAYKQLKYFGIIKNENDKKEALKILSVAFSTYVLGFSANLFFFLAFIL